MTRTELLGTMQISDLPLTSLPLVGVADPWAEYHAILCPDQDEVHRWLSSFAEMERHQLEAPSDPYLIEYFNEMEDEQ